MFGTQEGLLCHFQRLKLLGLDMHTQCLAATLVHCSQTSNAMAKWLGTVVHLHEEKLQLLYDRLYSLPCD